MPSIDSEDKSLSLKVYICCAVSPCFHKMMVNRQIVDWEAIGGCKKGDVSRS